MKHWLRYFWEIGLEIRMTIIYPFAEWLVSLFSKSNKQPVSIKNSKTIVLVERWFNKNFFHEYWMWYLRRRGFTVYFLSLPFGRKDSLSAAAKIKQYVERHSINDFTLVGISTGGVSCLLYLQKLNGWTKVKHFISLGSPFQGTYMFLPLLFFKSCRDLLPWSELFVSIKNMDLQNKERITCFAATVDELVPRWSSILPGSRKKIIPVIGHNNLHLYSRKTYDEIARIALDG